MTIQRAFTYVFEDPDALNKLVILAFIALVSVITTPAIVGFLGLALIMGWQLQLIRNVRASATPLMPKWVDFGRMITEGLPVLIAFALYQLPNLLIGGLTLINVGATSDGIQAPIMGSVVSIGTACCLFPVILAYDLVALPMFTIAQGRYAENGRFSTFFEIGSLWDTLRTKFDAVAQWWIGMVLVGLVFTGVNFIPCIGWVASLALIPPITGALSGMLHTATYEKPKPA